MADSGAQTDVGRRGTRVDQQIITNGPNQPYTCPTRPSCQTSGMTHLFPDCPPRSSGAPRRGTSQPRSDRRSVPRSGPPPQARRLRQGTLLSCRSSRSLPTERRPVGSPRPLRLLWPLPITRPGARAAGRLVFSRIRSQREARAALCSAARPPDSASAAAGEARSARACRAAAEPLRPSGRGNVPGRPSGDGAPT